MEANSPYLCAGSAIVCDVSGKVREERTDCHKKQIASKDDSIALF
jgi:hypothetical protein